MINFNNIWIHFECPNCNYESDIQIIDIKSEKTIFCHNCKSKIELKDSDGSVHNSIETMNASIKKLNNIFKKFGK